MAMISAFQADDPGSNPGRRIQRGFFNEIRKNIKKFNKRLQKEETI